MNMIRKWGSCVLCVLLLCLLSAGCGNSAGQESLGEEPDSTQGEEESSDSADVQNTASQRLEIETPVGTLLFPEAWAGDVKTKDTSADGQYAVSFYGTVNGEEVLLFELSVGTKEGSYQLGSAPDAEGNMLPVWLNIREIEAGADWSEKDTARINTDQECVNELIDQFNQMDGFQAAG